MLPSKPVKRIFTKLPLRFLIRSVVPPSILLSVFLCFLLILEGCASGRPRDFPSLSDRTVVSANGHLRLRVPDGWFAPENGETAPGLLVWLVKDDYSATMGLMEFKADKRIRKEVKSAGLRLLGELSFSLKQGRDPTVKLLRAPEVFRLNRRDFCSYEYTTDDEAMAVRAVVFDTGNRYYELTVIPDAKRLPRALQPIYDAQQAILQTLEW